METTRKKIELFTAGCPVCSPVVEWVTSGIAEDCDLTIYDVVKQCETKECLSKVVEYGIKALPAVAVNGRLLDCCQSVGISKQQLIHAGVLRATL